MRCVNRCAGGMVALLVSFGGVRAGLAQIQLTYEERYVSVDYNLLDSNGGFSDSAFEGSVGAGEPFDQTVSLSNFQELTSADLQAHQSSTISSNQIHVTSDAYIDLFTDEEGAESYGCALSRTYIEFSLAQDTPFLLRTVADGSVYGSLHSDDYSFEEYVDFSNEIEGTLPAGNYVLDMGFDLCLYISGFSTWNEMVSHEVQLTLGAETCAQEVYLPSFGGPQPVWLVGNAQITPGSVLRLTEDAEGQRGSLWFAEKLQAAAGFDTTFQFRITSADAPADGFAFVIQNEGFTALGGGGSDMGYSGITRSVAIEFDPFIFTGELAGPHISVQTRGVDPNSSEDTASLGSAVIPGTITDGQVHECRIVYRSHLLQIFLDGPTNQVLALPIDLENINGESILSPNGCAIMGFTAATGGAHAQHDILSWRYGLHCTPSFAYEDFSNVHLFTLNGAAAVSGSNTLLLTPDEPDRIGSAWNSSLAYIGGGFQTIFSFRISNNGVPADGMAFVIQTEGLNAIGGGGHALGYGDNSFGPTPGITRSLAVEFDTFGGPDISIQTNGVGENSSDPPANLATYVPGTTFADDEIHTARITYQPGTMEVHLDGDLVLSTAVDLTSINGQSILTNSGCAFLGFTAATGGFNSSHEILDWSVGPYCGGSPKPGDYDFDCDVDIDDVMLFANCTSGPSVDYEPSCDDRDLDFDGDVDQGDFAVLQRCHSGANVPSDANCAN